MTEPAPTPSPAPAPAPTPPTPNPSPPQPPPPAPNVVQETPSEPSETDVNSLPQWARESLSKANREAAQYRTQVRELEPLAQKARERDEADKTEQQRLADQLAAAQETARLATQEATRLRVAAKHGLDHELLVKGTEEEIEAHAALISAALQAATPRIPGSERPVETLRPGATPGEPHSEDDVLYASLYPNQA